MVSTYDETTERAYPDYPGGTSLQRWHRKLLRDAMESRKVSPFTKPSGGISTSTIGANIRSETCVSKTSAKIKSYEIISEGQRIVRAVEAKPLLHPIKLPIYLDAIPLLKIFTAGCCES